MADDPNFEAKLAAFSRSNRHRWAFALAIAAVLLVIGALVTLGAALVMSTEATYWHSSAYYDSRKIRLALYAALGLVVGLGLGWRAIQEWRGRADKLDLP